MQSAELHTFFPGRELVVLDRINQIRAVLRNANDSELAEFIGISRRSLLYLKRGIKPSRRTNRLIQDAQIRAGLLGAAPAQTAHPAHPVALPKVQKLVHEARATYGAQTPVVGPPSPVNLQALEDRVDQAMEELISIKKELRRMRS